MSFKTFALVAPLAAALVFASCSTMAFASKNEEVAAPPAPVVVDTQSGMASWYGPGFQGRRTANGESFDQYAMSAAHRTWPMGSLVRVTNLENGSQVTVRLNDRGPFARGRIIDVSRAAARELGFEQDGHVRVSLENLGPAPTVES
jgi:rare lipoprotein A